MNLSLRLIQVLNNIDYYVITFIIFDDNCESESE